MSILKQCCGCKKESNSQKFSEKNPCPECYGWGAFFSTCNHKSYTCKTCGRKQCLLHWPYPMKTKTEAIHFLKGAEIQTNKKCFIKYVEIGNWKKWKIFTTKEDYNSYIKTRKHKR